jgi:hypothetical protein
MHIDKLRPLMVAPQHADKFDGYCLYDDNGHLPEGWAGEFLVV